MLGVRSSCKVSFDSQLVFGFCKLDCGACGNAQVELRLPEQNPTVQGLYGEWLNSSPLSDAARSLFHTQYHVREKTVMSSIGDW